MVSLSVACVMVGLWTIAIAMSDANGYSSHMPLHHTRVDTHDVVHHANGGSSTVKVVGSVRKNVIVVGQNRNVGGVLNVSCKDASVIEILTSTPQWWKDNVVPGSVIIGSPDLGCKNSQGSAIPFYRLVANDDFVDTIFSGMGSTISIKSSEIGLLGCFGPSTSVRARYTPASPSASTQGSPTKVMRDKLTNTSDLRAERARRIELGLTFGIDETRSLEFDFNTKDGRSATEKEKLMWSKSFSNSNCQDSCEEQKASGLLSQGSLGGCKSSCDNITASTKVVCKNCYSTFDAGFVLEFDLRAWLGGWSLSSGFYGPGHRLEYALFKLFADAKATATVVATVQAQMTNKGRIDFFGRKYLTPITLFLGPIPIFIQSSFKLEGAYSVVSKISGTASAGLDFTRHLEMGYQYRNGVWQTINTQTGSGVTLIGPSLSAKASTQVQVQLIPQFSVDFQALARISVGLTPTLLIDASYECAYQSGRWQGQQGCDGIKWGVSYNIGAFVELDVTDGVAGLAKYGFDPRTSLRLPRAFSTTIVKTTPIKNGCLVPQVLICSGRNPPPPPPPTSRPTPRPTARPSLLPVPGSTVASPTSSPDSQPTTLPGVPTVAPTSLPTSPRINACDNPIGAGYTTGCSSAASCTPSVEDVSTRTCVCNTGFAGDGENCVSVEICTATVCGGCLVDERCVWCSSQNECIQAETSFTCDDAWESSCVAPEVPITNARINGYKEGDTITAGTDVLIEWDGGDDNGVVAFTWRGCEDCPLNTGLGLPTHLLSSRQFSWTISFEIFNLAAFQIGVTSATDPSISSITPAYVVVGGAPNKFDWVVGAWGQCDQLCDTGSQPRSVTCANLAGVVNASQCSTLPEPSGVRPCNTQSCSELSLCAGFDPASLQSRFPTANLPNHGSCRCLEQNGGRDIVNGKAEEFCGFVIPGFAKVGCNEAFCCNPLSASASPDNTQDCYDPCRTDSRWVVEAEGACTKDCGGGTQTLRYNCLTPALKGEQGVKLNPPDDKYYFVCEAKWCEINDGTIVDGEIVKVYESDLPQTQACNEQRCISYAFVVGIPEVCPVPCGGGVASRNVTCQSSVLTEVDPSLCTGGVGDVPSTTVACNTNPCEDVPLFLQLPASDQAGFTNSTQTAFALPGSSPTYKAGTTVGVAWAGGKYDGGVNISWALAADDDIDKLQNEQVVPVPGCACSTAVVGLRTWQPYCQTDPDDSRPRCLTEASSSLCPRRLPLPESNGKYFAYCSSLRDQALASMHWEPIASVIDNVGVFNWTIPSSMAPVIYEMQIVSTNDTTNVFSASFSLCVTSVVDNLQCLPCASVCSTSDGASCANSTARGCDECRFFTVVRNGTQGSDDGLCVQKCPADSIVVNNKCYDRPATLTPTVVPTLSPTQPPATPLPTQSPINKPSSQPTRSPTTTPPTTHQPTQSPINNPTSTPTPTPTDVPTLPKPTEAPANTPLTSKPSSSPSYAPSYSPSSSPSPSPTLSPNQAPISSIPTSSPYVVPLVSPTTATTTQSPTQSTTPSPTQSTPQSTTQSPTQSTTQSTTSVTSNPTQLSNSLSTTTAGPSPASNKPTEVSNQSAEASNQPTVALQMTSSPTTTTSPPTDVAASASPTMSPTQQGSSAGHDAALRAQQTGVGVGIGVGVLVIVIVIILVVTMFATGRWGRSGNSPIRKHSSKNPYAISGTSHKFHSTVQLNPMFQGHDTNTRLTVSKWITEDMTRSSTTTWWSTTRTTVQ
eukprot:m.52642 g.52642  ORF g.52642 m.52642 type:complete len:1732 (+) comp21637_c0_seq2:203-5398(+)